MPFAVAGLAQFPFPTLGRADHVPNCANLHGEPREWNCRLWIRSTREKFNCECYDNGYAALRQRKWPSRLSRSSALRNAATGTRGCSAQGKAALPVKLGTWLGLITCRMGCSRQGIIQRTFNEVYACRAKNQSTEVEKTRTPMTVFSRLRSRSKIENYQIVIAQRAQGQRSRPTVFARRVRRGCDAAYTVLCPPVCRPVGDQQQPSCQSVSAPRTNHIRSAPGPWTPYWAPATRERNNVNIGSRVFCDGVT